MQMNCKEMKFTLRTARLVNQLSQREAAIALGIGANTLASYECSKTYPDIPTLKRMEKLYGIRYDQMMFHLQFRLLNLIKRKKGIVQSVRF